MNPNYDEMANPDDTYVDISFGKDRSGWRLPEEKKNTKQKKTRKSGPVSDTMQNILLHLNTIPGIRTELPAIEDTPFNGSQESYDDGFVERPSGPFQTILPNIPRRQFMVGGIPDSELAAAQRGQRWNWHNENSFMPPGSEWNKTVWQGADRENQWLSQMLRQRGQDLKSVTTPIATSRDRATMNNMWKQFLKDVQNGHFDAYGGTTDTAQQWADAFRQRYEDKFGEGAAVELAPVAEVLGKRTELARKNLQDYRQALNMTENAVENISDWIKRGDFNDPTRAQEISVVLDKVGQNITAMLGGDSKGMADAEKIRIQIQYLPKEAKQYVYENIKRYRDSVRSIVQSGLAKQWSQNNYGKMNRVQQAAFDEIENDTGDVTDGSFAHVVSTLGDVITGFLSTSESELPTALREALDGVQNIYDTYMNNMVLAANVAPNVLYDFAEYLHRQAKRGYNKEVDVLGRGINKWTYDLEKLNRPELRTLVPPDELMIPPDYPVSRLETPPKGDTSSNPSSSGEQRTRPGAKAQAKAGGKTSNGRHGR